MSEEELLQGEKKNIDVNLGELVVVGFSAGGVEALSVLVSSLPPDFPAPIVLAQHLDPGRPSSLDTILRRRTPLSVELVTTTSRLEKGSIYVVPANRVVSIQDGHVEVQEDHEKRPTRSKPSIDVLLTSAAEVYGDRLIAVILTGSGSDGAIGAVEVKNAGGTVIVQDPQTARYPSMPLALPPTAIDFVADIQHIGPLLYDLLSGVSLPRVEAKAEGVLQTILELGQLRRLNEMLLRFLPVGVVVIDRSYRLLTANATARRMLGLRDVGNEHDFLHAVRGIPYSLVRTTIDAAFRERSATSLPEVELESVGGGNGRYINLSIALLQVEAGAPDLAAISIMDITERVQIRKQLQAVQAEQGQLMGQLSGANKRLNDVNKELLDANEELQVANEELVLTHEELQATLEEFETTNEELQATNEELETNNDELQATNEELETTNDELRARTAELQELTAILESERMRLSEMVELAPFYIMVLRGPSLLIEASNPSYTHLLGERVVQGRPLDEVLDIFWEADAAIARLAHEVYRRDLAHTTPGILVRLPGAQGEPEECYFVFTIVPTHNASGKVTGVVIYAIDETEQLAREAEQERARLRLIFDNASAAALALYDARTAELLMGSPRYMDMAASARGLEAGEMVGRSWHDLSIFIPEEQRSTLWDTVQQGRGAIRVPEVRLKLPSDEQETIWDWSMTPIAGKDQQEPIRFLLVSAVEITEQARAREEVERLNQLKDDFLSLASHELRTPLTAILGNVELLQRKLQRQANADSVPDQKQDSARDAQALNRIVHQIHRLTRLIDEMLDITRIRSDVLELFKQEQVNIVELARRVVEQYSSIAAHPLKLESSEQAITGNWDESRLEQVLSNLLNNALKYSPPETPVLVGIERNANEVMVWVRDQGPGISQQDQSRIFDRFYRAHKNGDSRGEGLGLGLYIAHEIVLQHGGRMWLESKPGDGSTFSFSLPLA